MNTSIGTEIQVRTLRFMIYAFIVVILADSVWAVHEGQFFVMPDIAANIADCVYAAAVTLGCYLWYIYVVTRLEPPFISNSKLRIMIRIPVIVGVILDLTSIFTGWITSVGSSGAYLEGPLYNIHLGICSLYLLFATILAFQRVFKTHSHSERGEYLTYALCMVFPFIGGFLSDIMPTVPFLVLSLFMVIHLLFLTIQDMQIFNDALTDLNNRRRLDQYLEDRLKDASEEHPIAVFMIDVNTFKIINDTYGHVEGDGALRSVACVLKSTASQFNVFIARYGGDEFCLVADVSETAPEKIEAAIHRNLAEAQRRDGQTPKPYTLTVSIGYTVCDHAEYNVSIFLKEADAMLYAKKEEWHRQNS
jgi:diguanylate cyclase (GGDEF)-like protein